ncbi:hypothetical protein ACFL1H_03630 [Nanoarchaeota archaeon]
MSKGCLIVALTAFALTTTACIDATQQFKWTHTILNKYNIGEDYIRNRMEEQSNRNTTQVPNEQSIENNIQDCTFTVPEGCTDKDLIDYCKKLNNE